MESHFKVDTVQKMKFSMKDFFSKWKKCADLVKFTEEILNGKLQFFVQCQPWNVTPVWARRFRQPPSVRATLASISVACQAMRNRYMTATFYAKLESNFITQLMIKEPSWKESRLQFSDKRFKNSGNLRTQIRFRIERKTIQLQIWFFLNYRFTHFYNNRIRVT